MLCLTRREELRFAHKGKQDFPKGGSRGFKNCYTRTSNITTGLNKSFLNMSQTFVTVFFAIAFSFSFNDMPFLLHISITKLGTKKSL